MKELASQADLEVCLEESDSEPVFILKYSTACPISTAAYNEVQSYEKETGGKPPVYVVKVIESRPVSNAVSEKLGVQHKSPQMILAHKGKAIWSGSHHAIYVNKLKEAALAVEVD